MFKKLRNLTLESLAGLSGNLIAGWIQNDVLNNLFTLPRLMVTVAAFLSALILLAWLESRDNSLKEVEAKNHAISRNHAFKLLSIP